MGPKVDNIYTVGVGSLHVVPTYTFLRHSGKVQDFHGKNPTTCHLTFAVKIRNCFTLGDMDYDNHTRRGE